MPVPTARDVRATGHAIAPTSRERVPAAPGHNLTMCGQETLTPTLTAPDVNENEPPRARLLLVEDDRALAASLAKVLTDDGYAVDIAVAGDGGWKRATDELYDLVLTDLRMPGMGGLELVARLREHRPELPVILLTAHGTAETAIEATKRGAYDFLLKPFKMPDLLARVARALERTRAGGGAKSNAPVPPDSARPLVGRSRALQEVCMEIGRVARQNLTVLICGETGTGKELVARAIWQHSTRAAQPFHAVNCAAMADTLLESELFGHEKGAFTGADTRRIGCFERAHGGTLFLDEIGDISPATQVRLLRVLQEQTIQRVGGRELVPIDVRVIAATHGNLEEAIARGRFREDLYYRLNVVRIHVPPLRERPEDVRVLAAHFAAVHAAQLGLARPDLQSDALARLARHPWPGNVRELENVIRRALLAARGYAVTAEMIEEALGPTAPSVTEVASPTTLAEIIDRALRPATQADAGDAHARVLAAAENELLRRAMSLAGGNQTRVSRWLGLSRLTLRERLDRHGLRPARDGAAAKASVVTKS